MENVLDLFNWPLLHELVRALACCLDEVFEHSGGTPAQSFSGADVLLELLRADELASLSVEALRCPNCGAPWTRRGFATTKTFACEHCGAVIEDAHGKWLVAQQVEGAYEALPRWPLGTRGKLDGTTWELI
ncbi:MAG: hypothetical protein L0177_16710, partial [Chloroflexi bacterium]|nr:hypothetical protein [Chloroflexota bacterium]